MSTDNVRLLKELGEPMAAGLLEYAEGPLAKTYCRGYRRYYETCAIVYEAGAPLFPAGVTERDYTAKNARGETVPMAVFPHYAHEVEYYWGHLEEKSPEAAKIMRDYTARFHYAGCWNHSVLNYKRILAEGIGGYERRLRALPESDFRDGLLDLIEGIRAYHRRALLALPALGAPEELLSALEKVPFSPAETAYEAMVSLNFCLSLDGFDNAGRLDSILAPYHRGEDLRPYLRCLMKNMQDNDRWSVTLGPDYNEITRQVIESSRGYSRPLVELRVTKEMPEWLWSLAAERASFPCCSHREKSAKKSLQSRRRRSFLL